MPSNNIMKHFIGVLRILRLKKHHPWWQAGSRKELIKRGFLPRSLRFSLSNCVLQINEKFLFYWKEASWWGTQKPFFLWYYFDGEKARGIYMSNKLLIWKLIVRVKYVKTPCRKRLYAWICLWSWNVKWLYLKLIFIVWGSSGWWFSWTTVSSPDFIISARKKLRATFWNRQVMVCLCWLMIFLHLDVANFNELIRCIYRKVEPQVNKKSGTRWGPRSLQLFPQIQPWIDLCDGGRPWILCKKWKSSSNRHVNAPPLICYP